MDILLFAFTHDNLGDDLFIKIICERYPHVNFHLPLKIENTNSSFKKIKNLFCSDELFDMYDSLRKESIINNHLKIKTNFTLLKYKKIIEKFDASVYIVGSAFIQSAPKKDFSNLILLEKMVKLSKKFFMLNTNFGPYFDDKYLIFSKIIIKKMTDICFRDEYSYNLFKDLNNVRYASDIVLSLKPEKQTNTNNVLVSVMDLSDSYINFIINIVKKLDESGYNCKLVSFCNSQNDNIAIEKIKKFVDVEAIFYNGNIDEILDEFQNAKHIIATRFHSMIISFSYNKNVLPIIYSQKTKKVIEDSKFNGDYIELDKLDKYNIEMLINNLNDKASISDEYKNMSEKQFYKLDIFFKEENYEI